jgi:trimethylamine:corrinoid methyltransferase-like protein
MWIPSEAEIEKIVRSSLRILWQTGCRVEDAQSREVLSGAGAKVEGDRVYIPEALVVQSLRVAPSQVRLADRRGGTLVLGAEGQFLTTGSDAQFQLSVGDDHYRQGSLVGLIELTRVANVMPAIAAVTLQLIPADLPANEAQLAAIAAVLTNSNKPCIAEPLSLGLAKAWFDLVSIAEPDLNLAATPALCACAVTRSPLVLDASNCRKLLFFADHGIAAMTMPCPMAGASSPFTLAGTVALTHAEALLQLALLQAYRPGCPVIYASAPAIMDMPTGTVSYAAPEFSLLCSAMAGIGRYLGLPVYVPLAHPDSTLLDEQCAAEKAFSLINVLASGAHLFGGAGALGKTAIASCEQLVVDNELRFWAARLMQGISVTEETLAESTVAEVGVGGEFLGTENTLRFLRSGEHWRAEVSNRRQPEAGTYPILGAAHERVAEILRQAGPTLPDARIADLQRYVREEAPRLDAQSASQ